MSSNKQHKSNKSIAGRRQRVNGKPRREFRPRSGGSLVLAELANGIAQVQGRMDALDELKMEREDKEELEVVECQVDGGANLPPHGNQNDGGKPGGPGPRAPAPPPPPPSPVGALMGGAQVGNNSVAGKKWTQYRILNSTQMVPTGKLTFRDWARAFFAAHGYSEKTHAAARGQMMKWRQIGQFTDDIDAMIAIVDDEYLKCNTTLTFWQRLRAWFNGFIERIVWSKGFWMGIGCVASGFIGFAAYHRKKLKQAGLILSFGGIIVKGVMMMSAKNPIQTTRRKCYMDFCTGTDETNAPNVDNGAGYRLPDGMNTKCASRTFPIGFSFGYDYIWTPRNCVHNELNALVTRQLQPRIPVTTAGKQALIAARITLERFLVKVSINEPRMHWMPLFLQKYPLARRAQIIKAMVNGIVPSPMVKGFPKIEVMTGKKITSRKVRFISGFDDGYLAETGPEYYLWQKAMIKALWSTAADQTTSKYVYTGGMTADQIGNWFQYYKDMGWTFVLSDASKFDSRNKEEVLTELYKVYEKHLSKELYYWLFTTFNKRGKTQQNIHFNVIATVASGRIDTSMGNTLIVFMLLTAIMLLLDPGYLTNAHFSALGDDNNTALPHFRHNIDDVTRASKELGHEFTGAVVTPHEYHKLEYCSQWVWQVDHNTSVLGPKIGRLLAKTFVCHKSVPDDQLVAHTMGVLQGFKNYRWLPVFRTVYERFSQVHPIQGQRYYNDGNPYKIELKTEIDVDEYIVRQHFYDIYGFFPEELEQHIACLDFQMGDCYSHPLIDKMLEIDGVSYEYEIEDYVDWLSRYKGCVLERLSSWLGF